MTNLDGDLKIPEGDDDNRWFDISFDEVVMLGCPGSSFDNPSYSQGPIYARCKGGNSFVLWSQGEEVDSWEDTGLGDLGCEDQPEESTSVVGTCGPDNVDTLIQIEFDVSPSLSTEAVTITVCHDLEMSRTLWARHMIWDE